jgi:hypothetical protein
MAETKGYEAMTKANKIIYDLSGLPANVRKDIKRNYAGLFSRFPDKLLSVSADAKTKKGQKYGFLTGIMYLTPALGSGEQFCPMSYLAQCEDACLNLAGRGAMNINQMSRLRKALFFNQYREQFKALLLKEVKRVIRMAARMGLIPLFRFNGTSDIRWERVFPSLFTMFPDVQFYDYTKIPNRKSVPANYDLTFSYSGVPAYRWAIDRAKAQGMRIATVFRSRDVIPETFDGLDCIDGDDSDVRHLDPQNVIVALYAKGPAKHDQTGFVID